MTKRKNLITEMTNRKSNRAGSLKSLGGWDDTEFGSGFKSGSNSGVKRCYHTHPAMKLPGTDLVIYGGNCANPTVTDADIYVGLCFTMKPTARAWPWKKGVEFLFEITDMRAPSNAEEFKKLIAYLKKELDAGKKVHVGCIGGHGRTGTLFAALVAAYGEPDAITYVRKNYCDRAVESNEQIKFLGDHFGVTPALGSKSHAPTKSKYSGSGYTPPVNPSMSKSRIKAPTVMEVRPLYGFGTIWE